MAFTIDKTRVIEYPAEALRRFHCFEWNPIDNLHFTRSPNEFIEHPEDYIEEAKKMFLRKGWEGDGEITLIWIPEFCLVNLSKVKNSKNGIVLWHVKQLNDGTSWLLSPVGKDLLFCPSGK